LSVEHGHSHSHSHGYSHNQVETPSPALASGEATPTQKIPVRRSRSRTHSLSHSGSYSSLYGHPAATRASLVQTAQDLAFARSPSPSARRNSTSMPNLSAENNLEDDSATEVPDADHDGPDPHVSQANENTPLLHANDSGQHSSSGHSHSHSHSHSGSMNMHAILIHVLGDALGNVGVIATGLIIWFSSWSFKYYFDPVISLVITAIIFSSALPLGESSEPILDSDI